MLERPRNVRVALVAVLALPIVVPGAARVAYAKPSAVPDWSSVLSPSPGPARVIGRHGAACIAGAVELPPQGAGFQAVDISRRRHYGHPVLVEFIVGLGRAVQGAGLGTMLVGDMAQPRGGPMSSGHVSHQGGLDVDIWFRLDVGPRPAAERENLAQPLVVDTRTGRPDPALWTDRQAALIQLAARDPRVSRVFVGAALKRDLCERHWPDRSWLRIVRPWPGHDDHLHVRLSCPADSPHCTHQVGPLPGEDCGRAELAAAIARDIAARGRPPPAPSRVLPPACGVVWRDGTFAAAPPFARSD